MSLPLRECGLKDPEVARMNQTTSVTPLAGVWIERSLSAKACPLCWVTPLAGVWIERDSFCCIRLSFCVTPLAGVWIERIRRVPSLPSPAVTPLAGVWIESNTIRIWWRHSPCGSVD